MIELIIKILSTGDLYGVSSLVDEAKGKHELPMTIIKGWKQHKRRRYERN